MSLNTVLQNQQMTLFDGHTQVWVFGYGSLIFKPDFPFLARRVAFIRDYARRFWQGSHDHRGTPDAPGRVVTLIEQANAICGGMAYLITPEEFAHLDFREKNGYLRIATEIHFADGQQEAELGVVYIARQDNAAFLGAASDDDIASQIANAHGPSGPNSEYLLRLAHALEQLGQSDEHVSKLAQKVAHLLSFKEQK